MNLMETIHKLQSLGYDLFIEEGGLRYLYRGADSPLPDQTVPLIEVLKAHKQEIVNDPYFLIDLTIREINEGWTPGILEWVKQTRSSDWERMLISEGEINQLVLKEDMNGLREALRNYKELMVSMVKICRTLKGETGDLFQQG